MEVHDTGLEGLKVINLKKFEDERGYFFESFNEREFQELTGVRKRFVQDNVSLSKKNVLRGLHFQVPPRAQGKYVQVLKGRVIDVAVDLRADSETFLKSYTIGLSESNGKAFYIPPGFAHGFKVESEEAIFMYKVTDYYSPEHDRSLNWDDPELDVYWGDSIETILSNKDKDAPFLKDIKEELLMYSEDIKAPPFQMEPKH